jgi:hypothetical protein
MDRRGRCRVVVCYRADVLVALGTADRETPGRGVAVTSRIRSLFAQVGSALLPGDVGDPRR